LTVRQALSRAVEILASAGVETPNLEAELLLRHTLNQDRVEFYLQLDSELSPEQDSEFQGYVQRRLNNEPTAYITGHREFYGLDFIVNRDVLIPRPESELLVDKALEIVRNRNLSSIADIGTGCGAIAISLAVNLPETDIYATDISPSALKVAHSNCRRHGVADRVSLLEGDLLSPLPIPVDLIIANLPYVREPELAGVNTDGFEPPLALNGGADGLEKVRRLCVWAGDKLRDGGYLLLEVGQGQSEEVAALLSGLYPSGKVELMTDLSGIERVVRLYLPGS
jgi:release factor glutamine methyltransferase